MKQLKQIAGGENVSIVDCAFHKTTKYTLLLYMIYNKKEIYIYIYNVHFVGVVLWKYQLMHRHDNIKLHNNGFNKIMRFSFFT